MTKRKPIVHDTDGTPKKARNDVEIETAELTETPSKQRTVAADTPSKQRSILKQAYTNITNGEGTPRSLRKVLFSTPARAHELVDNDDEHRIGQDSPLTVARNADYSARRKSTRKLFKGGVDAPDDEIEDDVGEDITQDILASDDDGDDEDVNENDEGEELLGGDGHETALSSAPGTPSKQPKLRGRPKGKRRARSPTPPDDLPPHELYFFQNRPGTVKTSTNTLPPESLLNHDDYFANINTYKDPHEDDMAILTNMHKASFEQWSMELKGGFNICMYGYGSKRQLLLDYGDYLYTNTKDAEIPPRIVVVNGYNPTLAIRDVLLTLANQVLSPEQTQRLPLQPAALLDALLSHLTVSPKEGNIYLLIHSIDASSLRKHQLALSRLAAHPAISVVASADTLVFPLLWDISLRTSFRFLFHDTTTFAPYVAELDPVEEVNTLLGRSGRRVGGKDGVAYVLRSLPENARNLYRILVAEQLALVETETGIDGATSASAGFDDDDDLLGADYDRYDIDMDVDVEPSTPSKRVRRGRPPKRPVNKTSFQQKNQQMMQGVEYRTLYHKAVEEFVCSSEMTFRTLLKEFHDHDMLESRKDSQGVERLGAPFAKEELEAILVELT